MIRKWDIQFARNPWLSVGFHFDHTDPSITLHLPGCILYFGRCKQPGFRKPKLITLDQYVNRMLDEDE